MATFVKRSQGLLLLALVLLVFYAIPAPIIGESMDGRKMKMAIGGNKAIIHEDIFNGCHYNQAGHDESSIFCCSKDNLCWHSLQECIPNCPCKENC